MTINLISLATVKSQLSIEGTLSDDKITAMIPIVSADVRRILNCQFDREIPADFSVSDKTLEAVTGLPLGTVVYHANIPDDTYIESFSSTTFKYTMSETPIGGGSDVNPTINISQWPTISKMIQYRIEGQNVESASDEKTQSESIGVVTVNYGAGAINKQWNYPQLLIDDLGLPYTEIG